MRIHVPTRRLMYGFQLSTVAHIFMRLYPPKKRECKVRKVQASASCPSRGIAFVRVSKSSADAYVLHLFMPSVTLSARLIGSNFARKNTELLFHLNPHFHRLDAGHSEKVTVFHRYLNGTHRDPCVIDLERGSSIDIDARRPWLRTDPDKPVARTASTISSSNSPVS